MNCHVKDALVNQLIALNNKLNLLSPRLVRSEEERAEIELQRESLFIDLKRHRSKGHDGKPCPARTNIPHHSQNQSKSGS